MKVLSETFTYYTSSTANALFSSLELLNTLSEEEDETVGSGTEQALVADARPTWMKQLCEDCESHLKSLPEVRFSFSAVA